MLNFHHLRYFHAIVVEGTLTAAAEKLNVSQSSMSVQLRQLEQNLGCALFERHHKSLALTEQGRIVFDYAETIFRAGDEMLATLNKRKSHSLDRVHVGAVATLSRNFQLMFLQKLILDNSVEVIIDSAGLDALLVDLHDHRLDLVLSNQPVSRDSKSPLQSHRVSQQAVSLICPPSLKRRKRFRFPQDLQGQPMVLPSVKSEIRVLFDRQMETHDISPLIVAEADDMAMLRLLAREIQAFSVLPPVVIQDELKAGQLKELCQIPDLFEYFYAITAKRQYPNPHVVRLLETAMS